MSHIVTCASTFAATTAVAAAEANETQIRPISVW